MIWWRIVVMCAAPVLFSGVAFAEEPAPADGSNSGPALPPAPTDLTQEAKKAEAREHFERGITLLEDEAWDAALAEFLLSRSLFATRANTKDAGICLRKLHRFDEAIDMFEALLREFQTLSPEERALVETQISELSGFVGTLQLRGAEPGSKIIIDGRERGQVPTRPLRVSAGTHVLRVFREGYAPFEVQISVAGAQPSIVDVHLDPLLQGGRLHVEEAAGHSAAVSIDGALVGDTPWDGLLPVGDHVVTLKGEGNLGTQPALVTVALNRTTPISLRVEPLAATLRVQPVPSGASLILDSVPIGRGAWLGPVREGSHLLEVRADGFVTNRQRVSVPNGKETMVAVSLHRFEPHVAERPGHAHLEAEAGFLLSPSLGGDLASGCTGTCTRGLATGYQIEARGGYGWASGLGLAIEAGYLSLAQHFDGRPVTLTPQGLDDNLGSAHDHVRLSGLTIGGAAEYQVGKRVLWLGRLGVGALIGSVEDHRVGSATTNARTANGVQIPAQQYSFDVTESPSVRSLYLAPEVRAGLRVSERVALTLGLRALVIVALSSPTWSNENPLQPGDRYKVGQVRFPSEALLGNVIFAGALSAGVHFEF